MSTTPNTSQQTPAPKERTKLIASIRKLVPERHINVSNPNQDYGPWLALIDQRTPNLLNADAPAFEAGVSELLKELGSSHTAFFHQRRDSIPAPYSINATLRAVDSPHGKRWMFVDVIEDGVAFQAGIHPGELLLSIDSQPIVPPKSANFCIGGNHHVEVGSFNGSEREVAISVPNRAAKDRPPMIEPRSLSHKFLAPDIGYIRVATFPGAVGQSFAKALDEAIRELRVRGIQRLIVDIRGNIGGGLGSLRLMSYLCPGKVEIGYSLTRRRLRNGYRKERLTRIGKIPATKAELLMMAVRFKVFQRDRSMTLVTEGLGSQPFHGRIVILINEHTHSAAEMVASFAKQNRLAMLVGKRTPGEVLGGANFKLAGGYVLRMPVAGWYTWQGDCIEGTGVEPDVAVENSPESLAAGKDTQFEKALDLVKAI
ncbi:MAG TPA: S41 family peptidase [Candidatus Acidoferrum sp.]|nr:S41 family peptidase [Candidatus Acidoferrum sp.]